MKKPHALRGAKDPCRIMTPEDGIGRRRLPERASAPKIRPTPTPVVMGSGSRTRTTPTVLSSLAAGRPVCLAVPRAVRRTCYASDIPTIYPVAVAMPSLTGLPSCIACACLSPCFTRRNQLLSGAGFIPVATRLILTLPINSSLGRFIPKKIIA